MKIKSLDPTGHIKLVVSNFRKSKTFYQNLFTCLGFKEIVAKNDSVAWVTHDGLGIWISQARNQAPYTFDAPGLHHICFKVGTKERVDDIYQFLLANSCKIFDAPQRYPRYTSDYYAVFFADPDGIKIEVAYY